tara:strand:- start:788 stop:964 length:177 start_codon:yes stop_codon:yes gene_type:complete
MKDLRDTKKNWASLSLFKDVLEASNTKEKVKYFDGYNLITDKFEYQLFDGQISKTKLK